MVGGRRLARKEENAAFYDEFECMLIDRTTRSVLEPNRHPTSGLQLSPNDRIAHGVSKGARIPYSKGNLV
jgi:hypothetical protein